MHERSRDGDDHGPAVASVVDESIELRPRREAALAALVRSAVEETIIP